MIKEMHGIKCSTNSTPSQNEEMLIQPMITNYLNIEYLKY